MEEENERILEFAKLQQQREEDRMEKKKQQEQSMAAVQQKVRTITKRVWIVSENDKPEGFYLMITKLHYQPLGKWPSLPKRATEVVSGEHFLSSIHLFYNKRGSYLHSWFQKVFGWAKI